MNKRIILIAGYPQNEDEKKSDKFYLDYYYKYFTSISGGAYEENEVDIFEQPTVSELKTFTAEFKADYAIIVLIGHGATTDSNQMFQINQNEIIKAGQLELDIDKQLVILESCRDIQEVLAVDLNDKIPKFKYGGMVRKPIDRAKAKELYENYLLQCENGITICLACGIDESAWNYYFSQSLIQIGFNWHLSSQNHFQILGIDLLMQIIKQSVNQIAKKRISEEQNPEIIGTVNYPFAVSKF